MKVLSVVIPCYNSEAYMEKCIESILPGGKEVEILIVDDGSSDRTAEIADAYAEKDGSRRLFLTRSDFPRQVSPLFRSPAGPPGRRRYSPCPPTW